MSDNGDDDGVIDAALPAVEPRRRPGTFGPGNKAAKGGGKGGKTKRRRSAAERLAYNEWLRILKDPAEPTYVKVKAAENVMKYEKGSPVSVKDMERLEPPTTTAANISSFELLVALKNLAGPRLTAFERIRGLLHELTPEQLAMLRAIVTPQQETDPTAALKREMDAPLPEPPADISTQPASPQETHAPASASNVYLERDRPVTYAERWWRQPW